MPRGRRRGAIIKGGTLASVIRAYQASSKFAGLADATRENYSRILRLAELPETLGAVPVDILRPSLVQAFLDGLADRPGKQQLAQSVLRAVEKWAIVRDLMPYPITTGTEAPGGEGGYEPWTAEQLAIAERFAAPHLARAVTLAANTGQRGSDLVKMRWSDLEPVDGQLGVNVKQKKTGVEIWIPLTPELDAAIATWERRPTFLLLKASGHPFTREQLSDQWQRERDTRPGLEPLKEAGCVLHGLRAFAVVRLRRAGATDAQIGAMVGMSVGMVARYSRFSSQRENALAAVHLLGKTKGERDREKVEKLGG